MLEPDGPRSLVSILVLLTWAATCCPARVCVSGELDVMQSWGPQVLCFGVPGAQWCISGSTRPPPLLYSLNEKIFLLVKTQKSCEVVQRCPVPS